MSDDTNKETRLSQVLIDMIDAYVSDNDLRYRAEGIRALIEIGLKSSEPLTDFEGPHDKRIPLSISKYLHGAVNQVRKNLTVPTRDKTYELAYRLVIVRGLKIVGSLPA